MDVIDIKMNGVEYTMTMTLIPKACVVCAEAVEEVIAIIYMIINMTVFICENYIYIYIRVNYLSFSIAL